MADNNPNQRPARGGQYQSRGRGTSNQRGGRGASNQRGGRGDSSHAAGRGTSNQQTVTDQRTVRDTSSQQRSRNTPIQSATATPIQQATRSPSSQQTTGDTSDQQIRGSAPSQQTMRNTPSHLTAVAIPRQPVPLNLSSQQATSHPPAQPVDRNTPVLEMSRINIRSNHDRLKVDDRPWPQQPPSGSSDNLVSLEANYFLLGLKAEQDHLIIYRHSITVDPPKILQAPSSSSASSGQRKEPVAPTGKKLEHIIGLFLNQAFPVSASRQDVYTDYRALLYSNRKLTASELSATIEYRAEHNSVKPGAPKYPVHLVETSCLDIKDLKLELRQEDGRKMIQRDRQDLIQALNIWFLYHGRSRNDFLAFGGPKSFDSRQAFPGDLGHGLSALRGFFSSLHVANSYLLLNVNVSHAAFYSPIQRPISLVDLICEYCGITDLDVAKLTDEKRRSLSAFLKGLRIGLSHLKGDDGRVMQARQNAKSIVGLAMPGDGHIMPGDSEPTDYHPPKTTRLGSGPMDVRFWYKKRELPPNTPRWKRVASERVTISDAYITVYDYYDQYHNIQLQPKLPVINVGTTKKPIYVAAEFCEVLPGQPYKRKLSPDQTDRMVKLACMRNSITRDTIKGALKHFGIATEWRLAQSTLPIIAQSELRSVTGRVLPIPALKCRDFKGHELEIGIKEVGLKEQAEREIVEKENADMEQGKWNMRSRRYLRGAALHNWSFINIVYGTEDNQAGRDHSAYRYSFALEAIQEFKRIAKNSGMDPKEPKRHSSLFLQSATDSQLRDDLEAKKAKGIQLVLVVLPEKDTKLYNAIKRAGDVDVGIKTVCVVWHKFCAVDAERPDFNIKKNGQYYGNVALKANLKLGGINYQLKLQPTIEAILTTTMVVGIDVTHPSPGSGPSCPSVAAMVATVDEKLGQWPAALRLQYRRDLATLDSSELKKVSKDSDPGQEMVSEAGAMLVDRLELWYKLHTSTSGGKAKMPENKLPANILIYRDGVSEGQYDDVLKKELHDMRKACKTLYDKHNRPEPNFTLIIVTKRHHTRFFRQKTEEEKKKAKGAEKSDTHANPKAGTLVDNTVIKESVWNFFLQSHTPLQGTARPAHYTILRNDIPQFGGPSAANAIEFMTYNLCWIYGRATRSVSYCPPAYYADRACERARCYLDGHFDPSPGAGAPTDEEVANLEQRLVIHEDVRDTMFYI